MNETKSKITEDFEEWISLSSARRAPIRSKEKLLKLINAPKYDEILYADNISEKQFNKWHKSSVKTIMRRAEVDFSYGWAAKLINMYLKTIVYIGGVNSR